MMKINWKMAGPAGYGLLSAGDIFAKTLTRKGYFVFCSTEFPSLIRGGHNTFQVLIDDKKVNSSQEKVHLLVALNEFSIKEHENEMVENGGIIFDSDEIKEPKIKNSIKQFPIPLTKLAESVGANKIMKNTVSVGASFALLGLDFSLLEHTIKEKFGKKGEEIVNINISCAKSGFDFVNENFKEKFDFKIEEFSAEPKMLISGNEAIGLGALKAGLQFMSAYPMTPGTGVLHFIAKQEQEFNLVVKQTEDELSAMLMAIGASFAGARSITSTSGGGFSLMTESLGLAAQAEIPIVAVNVQRPGPSTGLPTRTGQEDLRFMIHASQGEFPRIVVAPGDVNECYDLTKELFNLTDKYQVPGIILSDKFLGMHWQACNAFDDSDFEINRGKLLTDEEAKNQENYLRYKLTADGVSPRAIPGQENCMHIASGDEHNELGEIDETIEIRNAMTEKRMKKLELIKNDLPEPKIYGDKDADNLIICWGSTKGPVLEALEILKTQGIKAKAIHLTFVWPFPDGAVKSAMESAKKTILVENNYSAQLGSLIKEFTLLEPNHKILKYSGRQFFGDELAEKLKEVL